MLTGKSHFAETLASAVINAGMKVSWFSLESLTATLLRAKLDASVQKGWWRAFAGPS